MSGLKDLQPTDLVVVENINPSMRPFYGFVLSKEENGVRIHCGTGILVVTNQEILQGRRRVRKVEDLGRFVAEINSLLSQLFLLSKKR